MRFFKIMLFLGSFAILLPACTTEGLESECGIISSTGFTSIDCSGVTNPTRQVLTKQDLQKLQSNLDIHHQLWESKNVDHYCFSERYFYIGFGSYTNDELTNCISNGQNYLGSRNMEYHFDKIQEFIDSTNMNIIDIKSTYNSEYGHPMQYSITTYSSPTDGGGIEGYYTTNFQIKN